MSRVRSLRPRPSEGGKRHLEDPGLRGGSLLLAALRKCDPRTLWRNPMLFLVLLGATATTVVAVADVFAPGNHSAGGGTTYPPGFDWALAFWLWATLLAATAAEAIAEGRGRRQAALLRLRSESATAHRVRSPDPVGDPGALTAGIEEVSSTRLVPDDVIVVEAGEVVPTDGEVVWGSALIDESETTGASEPTIRSAGGDMNAVTGATTVLTDRIVVRVTARQGDTAVDTMIDLAEGSVRQKAPGELALFAFLASLSLSFVLVALTLNPAVSTVAPALSIPVLVAIVICLIPAEIAALSSVTGIAAMAQLLRRNVLVDSSHALETASGITTVMLDKTGTVTEGNRRATDFVAMATASPAELVRASVLASLDDPSPEGRSTLALAGPARVEREETDGRVFVPFTTGTRLSGADLGDGTQIRKGAPRDVLAWLQESGHEPARPVLDHLRSRTEPIARQGGSPWVVAIKPAHGAPRLLGAIHFQDVIRSGARFQVRRIRALGVRCVLVTGDNAMTGRAIGKEIGVSEVHGDASPIDKLRLVTEEQASGGLVAMVGDGSNDAAALARADIGVAMNSATTAAKAAANMIILDDDPARILDIIEIGRRQMATRGALVTFNLVNDLVRYFAIFPALFVGAYPGLEALNVLRLHSPASAILSTVIFGVVVIGILIPLALAGAPYRTDDLGKALSRNLVYYGLGGLVVAAVTIKLIDLVVSLLPGY